MSISRRNSQQNGPAHDHDPGSFVDASMSSSSSSSGVANQKRNKRNSTNNNSKEKRSGKKLYCLCQQPYNKELFYIQCDSCDDWFHGSCVKLPETLGEQIEKWFCPTCVEKERLEIKWKPGCARPNCKVRVRTENIYCSEDCAVLVARTQLKERISSLPLLAKSRSSVHPFRASHLQHLHRLKSALPANERSVRCLEFRQLLIDECIDRSFKYAQDHPESPICGFDQRIVSEWVPENTDFVASFDSIPLSDYFVSQLHLSPTSPAKDCDATEEDTSRIKGFDESVCKSQLSKCLFHDGWQLLKSREVGAELHQAITVYCLGKQKEVELSLRLLPKKEALAMRIFAA